MKFVRDFLIIFALVGVSLAIQGLWPTGPYIGISVGLAFSVGRLVGMPES